MAFIIVLVAMLVFMYFLLIRPQRAKQRKAQDMLANLRPGDEVITIGGIYGDVVEVHEDKVVLEIAEDIQIEVTRRAIANIVPEAVEEPEIEDEEDAVVGDDEIEAASEDADTTAEGEEADADAERSSEVEERTR